MRSRWLLWAALSGAGALLTGATTGEWAAERILLPFAVLLVGLPFAFWVLKKALLTRRG
jgi:hypothetical protein